MSLYQEPGPAGHRVKHRKCSEAREGEVRESGACPAELSPPSCTLRPVHQGLPTSYFLELRPLEMAVCTFTFTPLLLSPLSPRLPCRRPGPQFYPITSHQ